MDWRNREPVFTQTEVTEMQKSFINELEQIRKQVIKSYDYLAKNEVIKSKFQLIKTIQDISDLENEFEEDIKIEANECESDSF